VRFYYISSTGYHGCFLEKDLVKALYAAWNIEAELYKLNDGVVKIKNNIPFTQQATLVFAPFESNEFNTDLLIKYGYKMDDVGEFREIIKVSDNSVVKYEWEEVLQLI
jgi:hypothetical protein